MTEFRYFGMAVTNQNYVHEKVKMRLNSRMLATVQFRVIYLPAYNLKCEN
jgi:hypothetical protein